MATEKFDYYEAQDDAQELLAEFGRDITISRRIPDSGPPQNPRARNIDHIQSDSCYFASVERNR